MGKYSDEDRDSSRKLKKKKKKRSKSRSRSPSSQDSRYSHSQSKHKKSKKSKHRHRSKSLSPDWQGRRDRSPGSKRRRSRSLSRSRRSRSFERGRRSRSYERRGRSRSYSRGRRSRSGSRGRVYARKRSVSRDRGRRSRSNSGSRNHSRRSSRTPDRRKGRRSRSHSPTSGMSEFTALESIPGFSDMTPGEQAQARMKMALRAAAAADEKLKDQSVSSPQGAPSSPYSRQEFVDAVASIESDAFAPASFKTGRNNKTSNLKETRESGEMSSHHLAMFGAVGSSVVFTKTEPMDRNQTALEDNPETLFHPSLDVDPEEKMQRWIQKLSSMRQKKLEGDVIDFK